MDVEIKPPPKVCSPQQRKYLLQRLNQCRQPYFSYSWRETHNIKCMPPAVRAAKKLVIQWEKAQNVVKARREAVLTTAQTEAKSAVLFKSPEEALAHIEKYEALCKRARAQPGTEL